MTETITAQQTQSSNKKPRIRFIDAMRGFTMFLVVLGHIFIFSFDYYETESVVSSFFITFRMPMFFFISGYIGYKAVERWTPQFYLTNLRKKAFVQLIPSFIFLFIWCTANREDFIATFIATGANIYWFTEVLFEMFLVYFTTALISNRISASLFNPILIAVAAATVFILSFCFHPNAITGFLSLRAFCRYFQFFVLGLMCRKYSRRFIPFITGQGVRTILLVLFFSLFLFMWQGPFGESSFVFKLNHDLIIRYTGLMLVFSLFASHAEYFDQNGRISRTMQYVGTRTLDIYLLHYFFLPKLGFLKPYFIHNGNPALEFLLAAVLAIVVLCLSLAFSALIRHSDFLGHFLFGVKSEKYKF